MTFDSTSRNELCAEWRGANLLLRIRVRTRASRNAVLGVENGQLRVATTAAPANGDANKKIVRLLADYLRVPPSHVSLLRGQKHRNKQFLVSGPVSVPTELSIAMQPQVAIVPGAGA